MDGGTIFLIVWALITTFILTIVYNRGKKALSIFPDINLVHIAYRDKSATGHSTESRKTKIGGAKNTLDIVVTDSELWLKCMIIFAGVGQQYDMLHKIPLDSIIKIDKQGKMITVDFKTDHGKDKQVVLITKQPDDFMK